MGLHAVLEGCILYLIIFIENLFLFKATNQILLCVLKPLLDAQLQEGGNYSYLFIWDQTFLIHDV